MALKNLFAYLHQEQEDDIDSAVYENPYEIAHIPDSLSDKMRISQPEQIPEDTEKKAKDKALRKKYYFGMAICFAVAIGLCILARVFASTSVEMVVAFLPLIPLVGCWVFLYKIKRIGYTATDIDLSDIDTDAYLERMNEAYKEALAYMGVPEDTVTVDVLPYPYVMKKGKAVFAGKKNTFDNTPMEFFVTDGRLGITDGETLFAIPLGDIVGYRTYDVDYRIEFWLKEKETTDPSYEKYQIKKVGLFEYKTHTYFGIEIQDGSTGQGYELLIPGYDFDTILTMLDLTPLDS